MKTIFPLILITLLAATFASCANAEPASTKESSKSNQVVESVKTDEESPDHDNSDGHHEVGESANHDDSGEAPHRH